MKRDSGNDIPRVGLVQLEEGFDHRRNMCRPLIVQPIAARRAAERQHTGADRLASWPTNVFGWFSPRGAYKSLLRKHTASRLSHRAHKLRTSLARSALAITSRQPVKRLVHATICMNLKKKKKENDSDRLLRPRESLPRFNAWVEQLGKM